MRKYKVGDKLTVQDGDPYQFFPAGTDVEVISEREDAFGYAESGTYLVRGLLDGREIVQEVTAVALTERQPAEV